MFTVTQTAAVQIAKAAELSGAQGLGLRIAAKITPEGDVEFGMGFDEARIEDMEIVCQAGVNVLIGPKSWEILKGATMDYVELAPGQFGFVFIPPREEEPAPSGGGCGASGCGAGGCGSGGGSSCG